MHRLKQSLTLVDLDTDLRLTLLPSEDWRKARAPYQPFRLVSLGPLAHFFLPDLHLVVKVRTTTPPTPEPHASYLTTLNRRSLYNSPIISYSFLLLPLFQLISRIIIMSGNRDRYSSSAVSRRSSPSDPNNYGAALFQTSQGGITVLPPLSNIIPTPSRFPGRFFSTASQSAQFTQHHSTVPSGYTTSSYTQPRSTNPKIGYDLSAQALYGSYPNTGTCKHIRHSRACH